MLELMENLKNHIVLGTLKMKRQFDPEFIEGRNQDVNLYLDGIAAHSRTMKNEAVARRFLRNMIEIYEEDNLTYLEDSVDELINYFKTQYPGKKDIPHVQKLKGMMRELEEELIWGFFGFQYQKCSTHAAWILSR